jgi:hypothetical protein
MKIRKTLISFFVCLLIFTLTHSAFAVLYIVSDTLNILGSQAIVRVSSEFKAPKGSQVTYRFRNVFDNDSTTYWLQGNQAVGENQWFDIKFPRKIKIKGLIFGPGCRKDYICLEDNSVPTKIKVKLDEKPAFEFNFDWDVLSDSKQSLTRQEVNMRKGFIWFNCDTPFTTSIIQVEFNKVHKGNRYDILSLSDFEILEPFDKRFEIMDILSKITINPNDIGKINVSSLFKYPEEAAELKRSIENFYQNENSTNWKTDSTKIEKALNLQMREISDISEKNQIISALKNILIANNNLVRFRKDGRVTFYMTYVTTIYFGEKQWNIWRYIITNPSSKGIDVSIKYIPLTK